jgi:hypothetical protein
MLSGALSPGFEALARRYGQLTARTVRLTVPMLLVYPDLATEAALSPIPRPIA